MENVMLNRRKFVAGSLAGMALAPQSIARASVSPNERVSIASIGLRGRGNSVLRAFAAQPGVDIRYVVDVDESVRENRANEIRDLKKKRPAPLTDFRKALDDPAVDAILLGTPTHWHAHPTIMACQAGKDVYCEKPDAHNILEGRAMVAAGQKYQRVIQLGTQSRSGQHFQDAIQYIAEGNLGKVLFAKIGRAHV